MSDPLRILHVLDHSLPAQSGYTFRTRAILKEQERLGWDVWNLTGPKQPGGSGEPVEEVDGLAFYRTPPPKKSLSRLPVVRQVAIILEMIKRIRELADELKPDVIHAHSPALNGAAAFWVCWRLEIPMVYEVRAFWEDAAADLGTSLAWGPRYRLTRILETWVLRRAVRVVTICEGLKREMMGRWIPGKKITVVPNAVDLARFSKSGGALAPGRLRRELGLAGKRVIGFVGSFYHYEGLHLLIKAMSRMLKKNPDIRLLLVGGGPEEKRLIEAAAPLGDKIIFTGRVPHDRVETYYDLIECLVYPRLPIRLTELVTPLKPLEAMAQGRLVAASDVGGHRELIKDGETGALFKAGDADAVAWAVLRLLRDPALQAKLKEEGRRFVQEERQWPNSVANYQEVYDKALAWEYK